MQHIAIGVNRAPVPVFLAADWDDDLVQMLLAPRNALTMPPALRRRAKSQQIRKCAADFRKMRRLQRLDVPNMKITFFDAQRVSLGEQNTRYT